MAKRKPNHRPRPSSGNGGLALRRTTDGRSWVFVHPRCARDRAEDLEEAEAMVEAGELEIAADELRWLLGGCPEFIAAHRLLGDLALQTGNDLELARGHYGAGFQLGLQALRRAKMPKPLSYSQPANRPFFEAGRGLAWSLAKLGRAAMAQEVINTLVGFDPSDPLRLRGLLDEVRTAGKPIVEINLSGRPAPGGEAAAPPMNDGPSGGGTDGGERADS